MLPVPTFRGLLDYAALGAGLFLGFAILTGPMMNLQQNLRK
jgi:hypothetical protein